MMTIMSFPFNSSISKHKQCSTESFVRKGCRYYYAHAVEISFLVVLNLINAARPLPEVRVVGMFMLFSDFGY